MRLSASNLWRAEACAASVVLPAQKRTYADAERGQREHAALEAHPPPGSFPEVAFAYNVLTARAREVGRSIGRAYGKLEEGEIPGTADLVTVVEHDCFNRGAVDALDFTQCPGCDEDDKGHVLITDYKTGVGYMQAEPAVNPQLQHNALSAALVHDKPLAIVQLIYTKTGEVKDADFDVFDFAAIRDRLRSIWLGAKQADDLLGMGRSPEDLIPWGLLQEGPHCWRCDCVKSCPLKSKRRSA